MGRPRRLYKWAAHDRLVAMLQAHLEPGETLQCHAYGVRPTPFFLVFVLLLLGIIPGVIALAVLAREYFIGLTAEKLIVIQVSGRAKDQVKDVLIYDRQELSGLVETTRNHMYTLIQIRHPEKPLALRCGRYDMEGNLEASREMAQSLEGPEALPSPESGGLDQ